MATMPSGSSSLDRMVSIALLEEMMGSLGSSNPLKGQNKVSDILKD